MTRHLRLPGFYVALVAMLFRALLPAGWMPNISGAPGTAIVVCSIDGPLQVLLGGDSQPIKHSPAQDDAHQHDVCPFAAAPHFATPVAVAVLASIATAAAPVVSAPERLAAPSHSYTPQSPRGPPGIG